MNEVQLNQDTSTKHQLDGLSLISDDHELDQLAEGIANKYIKYLRIDVTEQKRKSEESIEECLTHLEEVCSVLENYRQNSDEISDIFKEIVGKRERLERLYDQIDSLEQYIFEINKSLDQMDSLMRELETLRSFNGSNRVKRIMHLLPKISLNSMPRVNLFQTFTGFISGATGTNYISESITTTTNENPLDTSTSIGEILAKVCNVEASINESTSSLEKRLNAAKNIKNLDSFGHKPQAVESDSLEALRSDSLEQVDGSWQELL